MIAQKPLGSGKLRLAALWAALAMLMTGCATQPTIIDIIKDVNAEFKAEYEAILAKDGTRVYKVTRSEAYDAIRVSMARLRMTVESQDPVLGYVNVFADAPLPLSADEWSEAARADLPKLQEICRRRAFIECFLIRFEPEGLQSTITGTVFEVKGGTAISFTARMREVAPPKSGFPRREYLPPTAVRMALAKIWSEIEREFKATVRRP
ncbi:MAG TPA: hypothetical protein VIA19_03565 [Burkholderiales bacterium]|jgi:hypothetical protein